MRFVYVLAAAGLLVLCGCQPATQKTERSKTLPDVAGAAVVIKHQMSQDSDIASEERWRYLAFIVSEPLREHNFTQAQIERFAKDIIRGGPYPSMEAEIEAVRAHYADISDPNKVK